MTVVYCTLCVSANWLLLNGEQFWVVPTLHRSANYAACLVCWIYLQYEKCKLTILGSSSLLLTEDRWSHYFGPWAKHEALCGCPILGHHYFWTGHRQFRIVEDVMIWNMSASPILRFKTPTPLQTPIMIIILIIFTCITLSYGWFITDFRMPIALSV